MTEELASPLFYGWFIDGISRGDHGRIRTLLYYFLIIYFIAACIDGMHTYVFYYTYEKFGLSIRGDLFQEIMSKDIHFFDKTKTGDLTSRLNTDIQHI